jgi:hypothetical protein
MFEIIEQAKIRLPPAPTGFFFGLLFDPEGGGDIDPQKYEAVTDPHGVLCHKAVLLLKNNV